MASMKTWTSTIIVLVASTALWSCSSPEPSSDSAIRGARVVEVCRGHGGVVAFDDDAVICRDQTFQHQRGSRAVDACREHGGVIAFDDDIVICRNQTTHEAEEG
jgi:hypothetical protein